MNEQNTIEQIKALREEDTIDAHNKIIEIVDNLPAKKQKAYASIRNKSEIRKLEIEIESLQETDKKNKIHLNGKLIKLYKKQVNLEENSNEKFPTRYKLLELQRQQKELTRDYKNNEPNLNLSEKVALTIKDIANTIDVFINEKDVITKLENIIKGTIKGTAVNSSFMIAISLISSLLTGNVVASLLTKILSAAGYVAITSTIRNTLTKTDFEKYQHYQSDEYKAYLEKFKEDNKTVLNEIESLLKEDKSLYKPEEKINLNENLIEKLESLISKIDDEGLRKTYELQVLTLMYENKESCQRIIDDYLHERNDNEEKYKLYNNKLAKTNLDIFKKENSIKDAFKAGAKEAGVSLATMLIARAILQPQNLESFLDLKTYVIPALISLTNGLQTGLSYSGKLKMLKTKEDKEIKPKDENLLNKLFNKNELQVAC